MDEVCCVYLFTDIDLLGEFDIGMPVFGLVDAALLLGEVVAGHGVGAGAGTAADFFELAGSALALELGGVAEVTEDGRVLVYLMERGVADVAGVEREESAGVDVALVGDEDEALAVVDAAGCPAHVAGFGFGGGCAWLVGDGGGVAAGVTGAVSHFALFEVVLDEIAAVVHRLGGFDLEADAVGELVDFAEDLLELFAGEEVVELTAADGDEEEDVPHDDLHFFEEGGEVVEVVCVMAADGGVDLDGDADFIGPFDGLDGACPGAGEAAEGIVDFRAGAVEGDAEADEACFLEFDERIAGEQRSGAGGEGDADALVAGVLDELEDVGTLERITAGEDEDGDFHFGDFVDELFAFGGGELVGMGDGLGRGAAVFAGQIAGLGYLPDDQERLFVVVDVAALGKFIHRFHIVSRTPKELALCDLHHREAKISGSVETRLEPARFPAPL